MLLERPHASLLVSLGLATALVACNSLWGVDALEFGDGVGAETSGPGGTATGGYGAGGTTTGTGGTPTGTATGTGGTATGTGGTATGTGGTATGTAGAGGGTVEPICGNGTAEAPEQCDDGDLASGDGCSSNCAMECAPGAFMDGETFHCYLPVNSELSWYDAQTYCAALGSHHVTFSSADEYSLVQSSVPNWSPAYYWTGARDDGGGYQWSTGESFSFTAWAAGEPDPNGCGFSSLSSSQWYTASCSANAVYSVCEKEPAGW